MSRWKKTLLILFVLGFLVLLAFVTWQGITQQRSRSGLDSIQRGLDQSDPGWRLEEIVAARSSQLPKGDDNPRTLTDRAVKQIPDSFRQWQQNPTGAEPMDNWLPEIEKNQRPQEPHVKRARAAVEAAKEAIETARKLRFCNQDGGIDLVFPDPPTNIDMTSTNNIRQIAGLMQADAVLAVLQGKPDLAIEDVQAILRAARAITGEPGLISQLVRAAVISIAIGSLERTLALAEPNKGLAELQADLLAEIDRPSFYQALRGERAIGNRYFENFNKGQGAAARFVTGLLSPMADEHVFYLIKLSELIDLAKMLHGRERIASLKTAFTPDANHVLTNLSMAAIEKAFQAEQRVQTQMRCAVVAIACERYRQKHGRWPTQLSELPKDLLPGGVPIDPYSGEQLRYKVYSGGAVIYGVASDGKDDQGNLSERGDPGTDIGLRLWDPDRRGKESMPE